MGEKLAAQMERAEVQSSELEAAAIESAGRERRIDDLERVATRLAERIVERERELRRLREELASARGESDEAVRSLAALAADLKTVRKQARGQATRIRLSALREAAEVSERVAEVAKRPGEAGERLIESLREAIERLGAEEEPDALEPVPAARNGHARREPGDLFQGLVQVEIGPLEDFSQLVRFEDAARSIAATSEFSVKRFSEGRATLEMTLKEPVELLRELEERCDLEFRVRDMRGDRLVLDVGESSDA